MHDPERWRTSSRSGTGSCVKVGVPAPTMIGVRDSKDSERRQRAQQLEFGVEAWATFLDGIR